MDIIQLYFCKFKVNGNRQSLSVLYFLTFYKTQQSHHHFMKVFTLMKRRVKLGIFLKLVWKQEEKSRTAGRAEAGLKMRRWRESEEEVVSEKT